MSEKSITTQALHEEVQKLHKEMEDRISALEKQVNKLIEDSGCDIRGERGRIGRRQGELHVASEANG